MTFKEFDLPYGNSFIKAKVPEKNISFVLATKEVPGIPDEAGAITSAMRSPTGSPALTDRLRPTDKVVVLVTDNTRACPEVHFTARTGRTRTQSPPAEHHHHYLPRSPSAAHKRADGN
jgi:nickel-dependent lactate racemase